MANAAAVLSRVLTEAEAAQYIKMSRSFLAKARSRGNLPGHTVAPRHVRYAGGAIRYERSELDRWLDQHVAASQ